MPSTRKLLLGALASLDADAPPDVVRDALDEVFTSCSDPGAFDDESCDGDITPLMIACDKSIASALNYLHDQIQSQSSTQEVSAWGSVTDKASESGNCAAHHALAADFQIGLDVLEYYACNNSLLSPDKNNFQRYMELLKQPNDNGDTPIMFACVYGNYNMLRHILERSFHLELSTANSNFDSEIIVKNAWDSLKDLFERRNKEGCSALNLACGHGHLDIVRLLICAHSIVCGRQGTLNIVSSTGDISEIESSEREPVYELMPLVTVTYNDVLRCQSTIDNLERGLKMMKQKKVPLEKQTEFQQQHKNILDCLGILNGELGRIATDTANILTQNEESQDQSAKKPQVKPSAKKKKKKKKQVAKPKQAESDIDSSRSENVTKPERTRDGWGIETKNNVPSTSNSPFITLQDGRVISKSQAPDDIACDDDLVEKMVNAHPTPKTLESILQSNSRFDDNAATTMESLCLDPSMLLLSAHGMAMETSPCQLDAIEMILTKQLRASKEARKIQNRLLNNASK